MIGIVYLHIQIRATDPDSGSNGELKFVLPGKDVPFTIEQDPNDPDNATLRTGVSNQVIHLIIGLK